jgi:hypothetical protein
MIIITTLAAQFHDAEGAISNSYHKMKIIKNGIRRCVWTILSR